MGRRSPGSGEPPVVVVMGASSGIGRATARTFARQGASLVLAARSAASLDEVAEECRHHGAQALAVPTDVAVEAEVQALVCSAVERFGRIDVWVGMASVYGYGTFEQMPSETFRQILETNLFGQVHGARAVLPRFRAQGAGTLILVGSVYSKITTPYVSAYVTAKFGLLGFSEVLREELLADKGINVCLVLPATIDTPIYQHAANYTGRNVRPLPPVVSPHRVARSIVRLASRPSRVVVVGRVQATFITIHRLLPRLFERGSRPLMNTVALRGSGVPASDGTVFTPLPSSNRVTGGWRSRRLRLLTATAAGAAGAAALRTSSRRHGNGQR